MIRIGLIFIVSFALIGSFHYIWSTREYHRITDYIEPAPPAPPASPEPPRYDLTQIQEEFDLSPYMAKVQRQIKQNWFPPTCADSSQLVTAVFKIRADGRAGDFKIFSPSASKAARQAALKALEKADRFPRLPEGAPDPLTLQFTFGATSEQACLYRRI